MAHDPLDDEVTSAVKQPASAVPPKKKAVKKAAPADNRPRRVVALQDVFHNNQMISRGTVFTWYGQIPKGSDKIAPEGTYVPDGSEKYVPGAPQRPGHAPAPPWSTQGHPDIVGN
jgi:hypothetical protein